MTKYVPQEKIIKILILKNYLINKIGIRYADNLIDRFLKGDNVAKSVIISLRGSFEEIH